MSATCSTLTVELLNYSATGDPNDITVTVDSASVEETSFGATFAKSYPLGDSTVAHTYAVTVDAIDNAYDRSFVGASEPCPAPMKKDASAALTVTPATCDTSGTLVLGEPQNAAWGEPSATTGPADYSVTATADTGHAFPDGTLTQTFTGSIDGRLDPAEAPCATVVVPDRPVPTVVVSDKTTRDCDTLTQVTTTTTTTTDWVLDVPTNTWVKTPPVVTTSRVVVPVAAEECSTGDTPPPVTEVPPTPPTTPPTTITPPTPPTTPPTTTITPPTPPTPPTVTEVPPTPPTTPPTTTTPPTPSVPTDVTRSAVPVDTLASTGSDAGTIAPIGAALLLAGAMLLFARRVRVGRDDELTESGWGSGAVLQRRTPFGAGRAAHSRAVVQRRSQY